jgi:hypothetical protein
MLSQSLGSHRTFSVAQTFYHDEGMSTVPIHLSPIPKCGISKIVQLEDGHRGGLAGTNPIKEAFPLLNLDLSLPATSTTAH